MPAINIRSSTLLLIDCQAKLMPAIDHADLVIGNARRLATVAAILGIQVLVTEQNAKGLGLTVPELAADPSRLFHKMSFDACREPGFVERLGTNRHVIVAGCEAHVCVLQTVLGLLGAGHHVFLVRDAVGSRRSESKDAAIQRMGHQGAELVTTEMAIFEWLETAQHPRFREVLGMVK